MSNYRQECLYCSHSQLRSGWSGDYLTGIGQHIDVLVRSLRMNDLPCTISKKMTLGLLKWYN